MHQEKPIMEIDTSTEGQGSPPTQKHQPFHLRLLIGGLLGLFPIIWMFLPLLKLEKNGEVLALSNWQIFFGSLETLAAPILFVAFLLPLLASVFYVLAHKKPRLNLIALILYTISGTTAMLGQAVYLAILSNDDSATFIVKTQLGMVFLGITAIVGALLCFSQLLKEAALTIRDMTEIAALVGIALILDQFVKIDVTGAGAGSIGLATLPLFILAYRLGPVKGFIASGIIFGLLSNLLDGYGLATYPFDYLIAFGLIGLAGLFRKLAFPLEGKAKARHVIWYSLGIVIGTLGRYLGSVISSMVIYEASLGFALTYNWYILASGAVVLVLMIILYSPLTMINKRFPTSETRQTHKKES
ncbi:MAG: energy-coupled thiamine transporter ThiT [Bacilli bacterium]